MNLKIADGFLLRELQGEYFAIPSGCAAQRFSGLIALNETGADIFRLLQTGMTREALLREMGEIYGMQPEELAADVDEILAQLRELDILIEVAQ